MTRPSLLLKLGPATPAGGYCFTIELPSDLQPGDSVEAPTSSTARLFEDERELGPAHAAHSDIRAQGLGRFSHWGHTLYLSSSDGSPVPSGKHTYRLLVEPPCIGAAAILRKAANDIEQFATESQRFELAERIFSLLVPDVKVGEYGRIYFGDKDFADFYERFAENNYRAYDRRWTVGQLARYAVSLPGSFAECGVYRGATAYLLARTLARFGGPGRVVHLFDSFAGLSRPVDEDGLYWAEGDMAASLEEVRWRLADHIDRVAVHPGWIPSRFDEVAGESFAFVHIDVDLYEPTRDSLAFFYDRMVEGGLILCDDYGFASCPGARRAMDEFFTVHSETIVHLPTGQGLVLVR
jgi:hypothetical protein